MSTSGHLKFQGTNRATFVGTTSNIMFDTTSTSLGIGVTGTDHPSSNLYITGNAYVSSNIAVGGVLTMGTVNVVARHDLEAVIGYREYNAFNARVYESYDGDCRFRECGGGWECCCRLFVR